MGVISRIKAKVGRRTERGRQVYAREISEEEERKRLNEELRRIRRQERAQAMRESMRARGREEGREEIRKMTRPGGKYLGGLVEFAKKKSTKKPARTKGYYYTYRGRGRRRRKTKRYHRAERRVERPKAIDFSKPGPLIVTSPTKSINLGGVPDFTRNLFGTSKRRRR